ncbi:MAG: hypothetical protein NC543_13635 [bacterium]|nr:hypothetical protein [bacterium]
MGYFITLLAKYCYSSEMSAEQLSALIKEKLLLFDLDNYQEYQYHHRISSICESLYDGSLDRTLHEREYIPIYEHELNLIHTLSNDRQKKLLFTFFAVARYMDCDGWINKKTSKDIAEVFALANVKLTSDKRNALLHELYTAGYIAFGKKVNNLNIRVLLDDSGAIAYKIRLFSNIGNQYIGHFKKGYKQCANALCGRAFKPTGANSRYCKYCARERQLEKYKRYNEKR